MRYFAKVLTFALAGATWPTCVWASDLRVAPATVEAPIGARTAALNLLNGEQQPLKVQIRVMRWTQQNGQDELTPTQDVVASPPFVSLKSAQRYVVRLVRTAHAAIKGEESYRIFVDELPQPHAAVAGTVNLVLRQSLPVFFSDEPNRKPNVGWSVQRDGPKLWLVGHNTGTRRLRISNVMIDNRGPAFFSEPGLLGYVLPNSEVRWPIPSPPNVAAGEPLQLHMRATADTGPLDTSLAVAGK